MNESDESSLIQELIAKGEGQTVEFKGVKILSNRIKFAKEMVAFANSSGGRILIGVCDDGSIEGMKAKKEHETHIMNIARDLCVPPLIPKFSVIKKTEGDIYVVKVLRYKIFPHSVKTREGKIYFIRVGTTVREVEPSELALLFEATREEISKKPKLELLLIDSEGNATKTIHAQPTFTKIKCVKRKILPSPYFAVLAELEKQRRLLRESYVFLGPKEPSKDLVPIGIEISNVGEIPAQGIRVFLRFPEDCELFSEYEATGGLLSSVIKPIKRTRGGLFVNYENRSEASAWIDVLGNDLTMRNFERVYVRFPEKEQEYKVEARITQHGFPPENFEFSIIVKPNFVEKVEYISEEKEETSN